MCDASGFHVRTVELGLGVWTRGLDLKPYRVLVLDFGLRYLELGFWHAGFVFWVLDLGIWIRASYFRPVFWASVFEYVFGFEMWVAANFECCICSVPCWFGKLVSRWNGAFGSPLLLNVRCWFGLWMIDLCFVVGVRGLNIGVWITCVQVRDYACGSGLWASGLEVVSFEIYIVSFHFGLWTIVLWQFAWIVVLRQLCCDIYIVTTVLWNSRCST